MARPTETSSAGSRARGAALGVLATEPRPGLVLAELCPPLDPGEAAALQTAWLKRIVQALPGAAVYLCGGPDDAAPMLRYFAGPGVELRARRGGDPAAQFAAAGRELLAAGHDPIALCTADTPNAHDRDRLACLDAARSGAVVAAPDQRGRTWLLAMPAAAAALLDALPAGLAHDDVRAAALRLGCPTERGQWARSVREPLDLELLWRERKAADAAAFDGCIEPPALFVRDLQAALQYYETRLGCELAAREERCATVVLEGLAVRLRGAGPAFAANGLRLPCRDVEALARTFAARGVRPAAAADAPADTVGGGRDATFADQDGNRLCFAER
jgi:catechol 2,3-dioxygenase-like lactoylglutathione lyase family enzyme